MSSWKRDAASGLVVVIPILVTMYILVWLYGQIARVALPVKYTPLGVFLTLVVFVLLVFAVGYLMRTALGSLIENTIDNMANSVPGLRVVYNASKMAAETAISGPADLQTPVKVELWNNARLTAFKTGKTTEDGREILFLPTAPNITSGYVLEMKPEDIIETDESVETALTRVLSGGFGETRQRRGISIEVTEEEDDRGDQSSATD